MANLDDLGIESITQMNNDEALELLRQIRLQRRVPTKTVKTTTARKPKVDIQVDTDQAAELLKILRGK